MPAKTVTPCHPRTFDPSSTIPSTEPRPTHSLLVVFPSHRKATLHLRASQVNPRITTQASTTHSVPRAVTLSTQPTLRDTRGKCRPQLLPNQSHKSTSRCRKPQRNPHVRLALTVAPWMVPLVLHHQRKDTETLHHHHHPLRPHIRSSRVLDQPQVLDLQVNSLQSQHSTRQALGTESRRNW